MIELGEKGTYTPKTGESDTFSYWSQVNEDTINIGILYGIKTCDGSIHILKEGDGTELRNRATGTGYPTRVSVKDGKLWVWE